MQLINANARKDFMDLNVKLAQTQESGTLDPISAFAPLQKQSGTAINAYVTRSCTAISVYHVLLQESGTTQKINAFVQLQKQCGMALLVNVR